MLLPFFNWKSSTLSRKEDLDPIEPKKLNFKVRHFKKSIFVITVDFEKLKGIYLETILSLNFQCIGFHWVAKPEGRLSLSKKRAKQRHTFVFLVLFIVMINNRAHDFSFESIEILGSHLDHINF